MPNPQRIPQRPWEDKPKYQVIIGSIIDSYFLSSYYVPSILWRQFGKVTSFNYLFIVATKWSYY